MKFGWKTALFAVLFCAGLSKGWAGIAITRVLTEKRDIDLTVASKDTLPQPLRLPFSNGPVTFHFKSTSGEGETPLRLRFKLEGADGDWRDVSSFMVVWLQLVNNADETIGNSGVNVEGQSAGWNGRPEDAPLQPFSLQVTAPLHADKIFVYLIGNGEKGTVGQMIVDDVRLRLEPKDGSPPKELELGCQSGRELHSPHGIPDGWVKESQEASLAQILWRNTPEPKAVLFLNDDKPDKYGVWRSRGTVMPVETGDKVTMECRMAYSIGRSGTEERATYEKLAPGAYWFRVAAVNVNGLPTGAEEVVQVVIVPPLTRQPAFWIVALIIMSGVLIIAVRRVTKQRMLRRMEAVERQQMLETERARIARDIHDDLGATLAQIAMLSEIARTDSGTNPPESRQYFDDIFSLAYESTHKLNEIIWAINPANDTLEHFVRYLCRFAETHLKLAGLRFRVDAPEDMPPRTLSSSQRHNLFLAAKEAIHNAVKHASATEVDLCIQFEDNVLLVRIKDNGKGLSESTTSVTGHGSINMQHRMEQINGTYQRSSTIGKGTTVDLTLPLQGEKE